MPAEAQLWIYYGCVLICCGCAGFCVVACGGDGQFVVYADLCVVCVICVILAVVAIVTGGGYGCL